jgi:radical SAM superfamily enzyme YgiQ (UPF0313 family)
VRGGFLFVQNIVFPFIGTGYVSSFLKKNNIDTDIIFRNNETAGHVRDVAPSMVGIFCMTGNEASVKNLARGIKESAKGVKIIVGGPHPTFFPLGFQDCPDVDYLCRGECDNDEIIGLLGHVREGMTGWKGNNIIANQDAGSELKQLNIAEDLDSLPFPDMDIYYDKKEFRREHSFILSTSRGCPYRCSYCYNSIYNSMLKSKRYVRRHSPEYVVEYLSYLKNRYGSRRVNFQDDVFAVNKEWIGRFTELYRRKVGLPYYCNIKTDIFDEDYARLLKEGGCYAVCFGVETGNEELRKRILNRRYSNQSIYETAGTLRRYGIDFVTTNMVGLPDETIENSFETVKLNYDIKSTVAWCSVFTPYPNTPLSEYSIEKGYIERKQVETLPATYFKGSILRKRDINEQVNLHKFFYIASKYKFTWPTIRRLVKFKSNRLFEYFFFSTFVFYRKRIYKQGFFSILRMLLSTLKSNSSG